MRAHWFSASSTIAALLLGVPGAVAQDRTTTEYGPPAAGEIGVQKRAVVTPEEQLTQAEAINRRAGQLAERLSKMLDEARKDKDILRANCVNRKLTEVNANTRNVEQRSRALKDAATAGDDDRRSHEFTVLTVLSQKLEQLDQEATQCLGQSVYEPGASQIVTTISDGSPTVNPSTIDPATVAPPSITVPPPNLTTPEDDSPMN
jgi:hypothetical protein